MHPRIRLQGSRESGNMYVQSRIKYCVRHWHPVGDIFEKATICLMRSGTVPHYLRFFLLRLTDVASLLVVVAASRCQVGVYGVLQMYLSPHVQSVRTPRRPPMLERLSSSRYSDVLLFFLRLHYTTQLLSVLRGAFSPLPQASCMNRHLVLRSWRALLS